MRDIEKINELASSAITAEEQELAAITIAEIISSCEIGIQFELQSKISEKALELIVTHREKLNLCQEIKDHFVWSFYREAIGKSGSNIDSHLLNDILVEYTRTKSIALESIIIQAIKSDVLTKAQISKAKDIFTSLIFNKEVYAYNIRKKISLRTMLTKTDVSKLIDFRLYSIVDQALENGLLQLEALDCITLPEDGTADKKTRLKLYQKAQIIRAKL